MESDKLKATVIGTGVGGAGIAALLAGAGFSVKVFERSAFPGGKTAMYLREGCEVDANVHTSRLERSDRKDRPCSWSRPGDQGDRPVAAGRRRSLDQVAAGFHEAFCPG
jgi:cation diffusion facilitator CzcD-associated flavoprotein CzcO